jgi:predicted TIM-barrel fold metal-dependent hydrolase
MIGKPVYVEISYALPFMEPERARRLLRAHPPGFLLFGSDSPWGSQEQTLEALLSLELGEDLIRRICFDNAAGLISMG